jgi:hypothetical protein
MTTAGVAVACGVCCVLPFAFPAVALTAFGSVLATFAGVYWWALSVAVGVVGAGWLWVGLQSLRTGRRAASSTLRAMALATLFLGAAVSWLFAESHIIAMLKPWNRHLGLAQTTVLAPYQTTVRCTRAHRSSRRR